MDYTYIRTYIHAYTKLRMNSVYYRKDQKNYNKMGVRRSDDDDDGATATTTRNRQIPTNPTTTAVVAAATTAKHRKTAPPTLSSSLSSSSTQFTCPECYRSVGNGQSLGGHKKSCLFFKLYYIQRTEEEWYIVIHPQRQPQRQPQRHR